MVTSLLNNSVYNNQQKLQQQILTVRAFLVQSSYWLKQTTTFVKFKLFQDQRFQNHSAKNLEMCKDWFYMVTSLLNNSVYNNQQKLQQQILTVRAFLVQSSYWLKQTTTFVKFKLFQDQRFQNHSAKNLEMCKDWFYMVTSLLHNSVYNNQQK